MSPRSRSENFNNPGVTPSCGNFLPEWSYCVEAVKEPLPSTSATTGEPMPTTSGGGGATSGIATSTPTQPGMVANCDAFHFIAAGENCQVIAQRYGISFAQMLAWNPSVGASCEGLWADVYVCVSVIGHEPQPPTTTMTTTTSTSTLGNGVAMPTPTQDGMVGNCDTFHFVEPG
ncbi:hypothetical protein DL767_006729 [Monosporascus sp. MG133]|nr:hypothetical protein DL767_006729 [Monosporascus sp. MG133]